MPKAAPTLGLSKIAPPQPPRKLSIAVEATLAAELDRYADSYAAHYGERVEIEILIPHILATYIAGDRGFKKWRNGTRAVD